MLLLVFQLSHTLTGVREGKTSSRPPALSTFPDQERRFNVIVCGVTECPKGVSRADRAKHDLNEVISLFCVLDGGVRVESVRDHFRLGKYNSQSTKPRHIFVKLTRVQEVSSILSNRSNAPSPLNVKPDLPPLVRQLF